MNHGTWWTLAALLVLPACEDNPQGGNDPPEDVTPPSVEILDVSPSEVVLRGTLITVSVQVLDASDIATVDAEIAGALAFRFPTSTPDDTEYFAQYPVATEDARLGDATFTVIAVDAAGNAATASVQLLFQ